MANGYRLEKEDILKLGFGLIEHAERKDFLAFYKGAWSFIFEVKIDLNTAIESKDQEREILYTNSIAATSNLVERIIQLDDVYTILDQMDQEKDN